MIHPLTPTRSMSSRRQAALEFIRRHFRKVGASPSHSNIAEGIGIDRRHVGAILRQLAKLNALTFTAGKAHSIVLTNRLANFATSELELEVTARGGHITWASPIGRALIEAIPVLPADEGVADYGLHLLDQLDDKA